MTVLLALRRIGPYHHVRLAAAARQLPLQVLETRPHSQEYPWSFRPPAAYPRHALRDHPHAESDPARQSLRAQLEALLDQLQPRVLVSVGWADRSDQLLLLLAQQRRLPLVIVSDSRVQDEPRRPPKEWIKQQLLRGCSSALVAGRESRAYLQALGFPAAAIFQPWDVVDNTAFAMAAAQAATTPAHLPHFLCVARLVAKKNHQLLLRAYATYQRQGGRWGLRLIGSGPLEASIRADLAALPDPTRAWLTPFQQFAALAESYGQASAFVLASSSDQWGLVVNEAMAAGLPCLVSQACGCAVDLIEHGISGWCFDPHQVASLVPLLHAAAAQPPAQRTAMRAAARRRLAAYGPEAFAAGLQQAITRALCHPRFSDRAALTAALLSWR